MLHKFLSLLLFIVIAFDAGRQVVAEPVANSKECPIAPSDDWSPQEKFVWSCACRGVVADFNTEPGYGKELDPKEPKKWPVTRVLRTEFLEAILTNEKYRSSLSRIGVRIIGARFTKSIDLENAEIHHDVWLAKSLIEGDFNLKGLNTKRSIVIDYSRISGSLQLEGAHFDGYLSVRHAELWRVDSINASFLQLILTDSKVAGKLDLNTVKIEGILAADYVASKAVDLVGARVGGQVTFHGSNVSELFEGGELEVGKDLALTDGHFGVISLLNVKVKGTVLLWGATFSADLDLSGAEIEGGLELGSESSAAKWSDKSSLILRDTKIGTIPKFADSWAPTLDLEGLTYRALKKSSDGLSVDWLSKSKSFNTQPYEQLATVLQGQGRLDEATAVRFAGRERERKLSSGWKGAWLTSLDWLIGYGYYPIRSVGWAVGLVILGAVVLLVSGEGRKNGLPFGFAYSFDLLLPIIKLREMHYKIDLQSWARYYFYAHKIAGYLLASFLVAGLSGLTK